MPPLPQTVAEWPYKRPFVNLTLSQQEIEVRARAGTPPREGLAQKGGASRAWRAPRRAVGSACPVNPPCPRSAALPGGLGAASRCSKGPWHLEQQRQGPALAAREIIALRSPPPLPHRRPLPDRRRTWR